MENSTVRYQYPLLVLILKPGYADNAHYIKNKYSIYLKYLYLFV